MTRSRGDMASPTRILLATLHFVAYISAGPLPNVTTVDIGLKEGSCAVGDVVYLPGDEFPGSTPCEKCTCAHGGVDCTKQQCEPRPGCKALHRPDHCCPTYQCECEQEGRVYGNGEKLVDPADPCRVCYCQGGEVVCRRIACFVRNDCTPRLVPGRCCPEYDNCPLRGVTSLPGMSSQSFSLNQDFESNPSPAIKENTKQEFTIKEITPVSEIPVITNVKIKEILPSPSIDVLEYSSSKSPLIPREATSEKSVKYEELKTESPTIMEIHPASSESKDTVDQNDSTPSKISFSTQDSINSDIYPSLVPAVASHSSSGTTATTTKSPMLEEEEDHNPAFPPIPEDLTLYSTHEEEIAQESPIDLDHVGHDMSSIPSEVKEEPLPTTPTDSVTKEKSLDISVKSTTAREEGSTTDSPVTKGSPLLNLRSAIATEILSAPANVPDDLANDNETSDAQDLMSVASTTKATKILDITTEGKSYATDLVIEYSSTDNPLSEEISTDSSLNFKIDDSSVEIKLESQEEDIISSTELPEFFTTTQAPKVSEIEISTKGNEEQTTSSIAKSNIATEVTSQTELSSLPIETSDQKPHEPENVSKDKPIISSSDPFSRTTNIPTANSEVITVSKILTNEKAGFENIETTEFILTSFGSAESATDAVELIKISGDHEKSSAIIEAPEPKKNNVLTDLINLVSDVASINDHTDTPSTSSSSKTGISESEELIPVNAVYKSKSNYNQNSITEVPLKNKNTPANKQKIVEIEDDDAGITDSLPPNDKIEPTTKRPIIDKVSEDTMPGNKTEKKDIEIITQSYVPTINRKPTKVVLKEEAVKATTQAPFVTEGDVSSEIAVVTENNVSSEVPPVPEAITNETEQDATVSIQ